MPPAAPGIWYMLGESTAGRNGVAALKLLGQADALGDEGLFLY